MGVGRRRRGVRRGRGRVPVVVRRTGIGVYDIERCAGRGHGRLDVGGRVCGGYAEGSGMHEGRCRINVHWGVQIKRGHLNVWIVLGELVRVGIVLGLLGDGGRRCIEVVAAEDPNEAPVAWWTEDATRAVANHGGRVKGLVWGCRGGEEHALIVVVAVEAMEKREEDRVWGVVGEMFEVHAGKVVCWEEGDMCEVVQLTRVGGDDAIARGGGHELRRVLEESH